MSAPAYPALVGVRVLVVDDDEDGREMIATVLERSGALVSMAASVDEALVAFERDSPRALVCDIGLPTEDGFSLLRKIRAIEATRGGHIAAVALSGYGSDEDRERSSAGGFHEHLTKPVALPEFLRTLADMLAKPSSGNSPSGNLPNG